MTENNKIPICPHCKKKLNRFEMPAELSWKKQVQYVCFNDSCSYFLDGWEWMEEKYGKKTSYRYRLLDAATGATSPLMVWSKDALKDHISR